jgi:hypothetical protein
MFWQKDIDESESSRIEVFSWEGKTESGTVLEAIGASG